MKKEISFSGSIRSFSMLVRKEGKMIVAWNPELDIADQCETIEEAMKNLKDAIKFHMETFKEELPEKSFVGFFSSDIEIPNRTKEIIC